MKRIANYKEDDYGTKKTIAVTKCSNYINFDIESKHFRQQVKVRNVGKRNVSSSIQFEIDTSMYGRKGNMISFSIPEELADIFIQAISTSFNELSL